MSEPPPNRLTVSLEEYRFRSKVPVLGSLIVGLRSIVYNAAARWGVQHVIVQQNQINAQLAERLQELEARLIDQDRDLALMARALAELQIRQRHRDHASVDETSER
jgi:hypothetical protein